MESIHETVNRLAKVKEVYLKVPHTNDDDADYFVFNDIESAARYIKVGEIYDYIISSTVMDIPAEDYTFQV